MNISTHQFATPCGRDILECCSVAKPLRFGLCHPEIKEGGKGTDWGMVENLPRWHIYAAPVVCAPETSGVSRTTRSQLNPQQVALLNRCND